MKNLVLIMLVLVTCKSFADIKIEDKRKDPNKEKIVLKKHGRYSIHLDGGYLENFTLYYGANHFVIFLRDSIATVTEGGPFYKTGATQYTTLRNYNISFEDSVNYGITVDKVNDCIATNNTAILEVDNQAMKIDSMTCQ